MRQNDRPIVLNAAPQFAAAWLCADEAARVDLLRRGLLHFDVLEHNRAQYHH
jgi:hypothetical protein